MLKTNGFVSKLLAGAGAPTPSPTVAPAFRVDAIPAPRRLVGADLDRERDDASHSVAVLVKTRALIDTEIKRLTAELHATEVALEAKEAAIAVLAKEQIAQEKRVDAHLDDLDLGHPAVALEKGLRDVLRTGQPPRANPEAFAAANRAKLANEKRLATVAPPVAPTREPRGPLGLD